MFDVRGNRKSLTTTGHVQGTDMGTACTTAVTGTSAKAWGYDGADRLTAAATVNGTAGGPYAYDPLGRATTIPAVDTVAGTGNITLGYYDTDAAHTIAQGGVTTTYTLDPAGRRATETTTGTKADGTSADEQLVRHYPTTRAGRSRPPGRPRPPPGTGRRSAATWACRPRPAPTGPRPPTRCS